MSTRSTGGRPWRRAREHLKRAGAPCYLCGGPIDYEAPPLDPMAYQADHVIAKANGGSDRLSNLKPTHRKCNRLKSDKTVAPVLRRSNSLRR